MYLIIIVGCIGGAVWLFRKDPRSIAPGALLVVALQALLFAVDDVLMGGSYPVLEEINRVAWLLIYTVGPLFSAAILFIYAATVLPAERFDASHKMALVGGIVAVGVAVYHLVYYRLQLPDSIIDLYLDILAALMSYIAFMYVAYGLSSRMYFSSKASRRPFDCIMVLGYRLDGDNMSAILVARCDKAYDCWVDSGRSVRIVLSGGQCFAGTLSESEAMRRYLMEKGVPENLLVSEGQSATTLQNMKYSKQLMEQWFAHPRCLVITSEFHVLRALMLAVSVGIDAQGAGSRSPRNPLFVGLTTREMVAFIFRRKDTALMFAEAMLFLEAWRYVQIPLGVFS